MGLAVGVWPHQNPPMTLDLSDQATRKTTAMGVTMLRWCEDRPAGGFATSKWRWSIFRRKGLYSHWEGEVGDKDRESSGDRYREIRSEGKGSEGAGGRLTMLYETLDSVRLVLPFKWANNPSPTPTLFLTYARLALDFAHLQQRNLNKCSLSNPFKMKSSPARQGQAGPLCNLQEILENEASKQLLRVNFGTEESWYVNHSCWDSNRASLLVPSGWHQPFSGIFACVALDCKYFCCSLVSVTYTST